jgi:hypothetical protein
MSDQPRMEYIAQHGDYDCSIAVLAMVTGHDYADVFSTVEDAMHAGVEDDAIFEYLADHGFFWRLMLPVSQCYRKIRDITRPAAARNIAKVINDRDSQNYHLIAVDGQGLVFDPCDAEIKSLDSYPRVVWLAGVISPV